MPKQDDGITLKTILDHMQNMQRVLMAEIQGVEKRLTIRIDRMEARIDKMDVNLTAQIDAIDKRLDAIEIEKLPDRVKKLEVAVGLR